MHLDDHVGMVAGVLDVPGVVAGAQVPHEVGLGTGGDLVEHVDLEAPLHGQQGGQQADGSGAGHHHVPGVPGGPSADLVDLVPRLSHHAGGLQQDTQRAEGGVDLHHELRGDAVALRAVPVVALDAALGVLAVAAEVPLPGPAIGARHRVGAAHDAHDQVARGHARACGGLEHPAQGLVAEHQAVAPGRCPAIGARHDLRIGAAHPDGEGLDEHRPVTLGRFVDVLEAGRTRRHRLHGHRLHGCIPFIAATFMFWTLVCKSPSGSPGIAITATLTAVLHGRWAAGVGPRPCGRTDLPRGGPCVSLHARRPGRRPAPPWSCAHSSCRRHSPATRARTPGGSSRPGAWRRRHTPRPATPGRCATPAGARTGPERRRGGR